MNNNAFPNPINCYIIQIQPYTFNTEQHHINCPQYSSIFPVAQRNILNHMFSINSPTVNIITSHPPPITNADVQSNALPKVTTKIENKKEDTKHTRHYMTKSEYKKVNEDRAIRSFQKLYRQVVTCYFCNNKVKKIKTFAYQTNYFVCTDCVVSNYISKSLLVDWDLEGDIECHKCKKRRLLSSYICYKENGEDFIKSRLCIYCRNLQNVFEMRKELKKLEKE